MIDRTVRCSQEVSYWFGTGYTQPSRLIEPKLSSNKVIKISDGVID